MAAADTVSRWVVDTTSDIEDAINDENKSNEKFSLQIDVSTATNVSFFTKNFASEPPMKKYFLSLMNVCSIMYSNGRIALVFVQSEPSVRLSEIIYH